MLKREITFTNFNDEEVTETLYFNLTKSELLELEVEYEGGLGKMLLHISETKDEKKLFGEFKRILLLSYGEKSVDGRTFVKSEEIRENFSHTAAFDAIFSQITTDAGFAADFAKGILPKDLLDEVEKEQAEREAKEAQTKPSSAELIAQQSNPEA